MKKNFLILFLCINFSLLAQEYFPVNGVADKRLDLYAFTNATIVTDSRTSLEKATLVIRNGFIESVGTGTVIPKGAIVVDLNGKYVYPSFVEPYSNYGMPEVKRNPFNWFAPPQLDAKRDGPFGWNDAIKTDFNAADNFKPDTKAAEKLKKAGFGTVLTFRADGIARGTSALVTLNEAPIQELVLKTKVSAHYAFDRGSSTQEYPNSLMGMVALLRQTLYDAEWYKSPLNRTQTNLSLASINEIGSLPQIFESDHKARTILADKIGDEFKIQYIIKGAGDEYQRIQEIKKTGASLIIPVNFPKAYDLEDPYNAINVAFSQMKHWELAPTNPAVLAKNTIPFAFTSNGLEDVAQLLPNIRKAIEHGLSEENALKALTETPAALLKVDDKVGSIKAGKLANFIITSGKVFDEKTTLYENWIQGKKFTINDMNLANYAGKYKLNVNGNMYNLEISGKPSSPQGKVKKDTLLLETKLTVDGATISLSFQPEKGKEAKIRLSGWSSGKDFKGNGQLENGDWIQWNASFDKPLDEKQDEKKTEKKENTLGKVVFPFSAFGNEEIPTQNSYLIKNTTVWTSEEQGILKNTDVLVQNGKITQVGQNITPPTNTTVIDGEGKHLTPGIIDEHSHIALFTINEGSQNSSAEVRMEDVIDAEDRDIYNQLAGGVTAAQLLHGSANPVGGQSALIKLRWGVSPQDLLIKGADAFIKFALGENVKQSNGSPSRSVRFPQTRMGVEQVYVDLFTRAREYESEWKKYNTNPAKATISQPRRDLELETILQILNKQRYITCHSYVQSEINMMMKVAEQFNFRINTFTHILEGYKVADIMAKHGAAGSTFSDWWQYKYEVREAIPQNAALMILAGVNTCINSDDAEMARRLNQEAAKSIKYAGIDEVTAFKMVTINPAKMLHIDKITGSIKVGKDADLVLWTENPLSIYAKVDKTFVDGIIYYSTEKDAEAKKYIQSERARITAKMKDVKAGGTSTQKPTGQYKHRWDCEEEIQYDMNEK
ncbi:MAG: amidohydrolase family protein [Chitinophagaceae bacterium]|nr:amidohydrolase family protein [Chitinophagaceae bacterium]